MASGGMILSGLLVTAGIALVSGRNVRSTRDSTIAGRRAGRQIVAGIIVGALVGGSSTVGTAQAAFVYGLPAGWFTLGAGLGCLVLAAFFAPPLRRSAVETLPHFLVGSFGGPMRERQTVTVTQVLGAAGKLSAHSAQLRGEVDRFLATVRAG